MGDLDDEGIQTSAMNEMGRMRSVWLNDLVLYGDQA
jgi:hypothetical protein